MVVASRQPELFTALGVTWSVATTALVLRLWARRMTKIELWWDDYLAVGAYLCAVLFNAILLKWTREGFGLLLNDTSLPPEISQREARQDIYFSELCYAFSLAFAKLAILAFYWRLFKLSSIKIPIIVLAVCSIIWLILRTFLALFHCVPVAAFWDQSIRAQTCRIDDSRFFIGTVTTHLLIDVAIMALPVLQIRKLQLSLVRKIGVSALFMFGIFVCIASVAVIAYSFHYDPKTPEMSWEIASIFIWASVEVNLAVVSACLPMLRPIFVAVRSRLNTPKPRNTRDVYHKAPKYHHSPERDSRSSRTGVYPPGSFLKVPNFGGSKTGFRVSNKSVALGYRLTVDDEDRAMDGSTGRQVTITGNHQEDPSEVERGEGGDLYMMGGIVVKSEIGVHISEADSPGSKGV